MYISSPNYDLGVYYPNDVDCRWYFADKIIGTYIVTIIDMETQYWDTLSLGFGDKVVEESRVALLRERYFPSTILIPHTRMWIRFHSNHNVRFRGFLLEVERIPKEGKNNYLDSLY